MDDKHIDLFVYHKYYVMNHLMNIDMVHNQIHHHVLMHNNHRHKHHNVKSNFVWLIYMDIDLLRNRRYVNGLWCQHRSNHTVRILCKESIGYIQMNGNVWSLTEWITRFHVPITFFTTITLSAFNIL